MGNNRIFLSPQDISQPESFRSKGFHDRFHVNSWGQFARSEVLDIPRLIPAIHKYLRVSSCGIG